MGISNFPKLEVPRECMLGPDQEIGKVYEDAFAKQLKFSGGTGWTLEHSWTPYHCDPCTGPTLEDTLMMDLGYNFKDGAPWISRVHVRYAADITQDLMFYKTGTQESTQTRFIRFNPTLMNAFQMCDPSQGEDFDEIDQCVWTEQEEAETASFSPVVTLGALCTIAGVFVRRRRKTQLA